MTRFAWILACTTLAGLFYVYEEVEAVKLGYFIRKQQEEKTQFLDRSRALKYNIASLKASGNLERRLQAERITLEPPRSWQTLVLADRSVKKPTAMSSFLNSPFLSKLFIGTAQAEAKESSR